MLEYVLTFCQKMHEIKMPEYWVSDFSREGLGLGAAPPLMLIQTIHALSSIIFRMRILLITSKHSNTNNAKTFFRRVVITHEVIRIRSHSIMKL